MRDEPRPWPTAENLDVLVKQSEGLFIYVSTLVKFVGDGNGLPQQKLRDVMRVHTGVDPLYDQVLTEARKFDKFELVIGAIMFLNRPLGIRDLEQLLQLPSGGVRLALRGCQSVLVIPDSDIKDPVLPYHASLRDFLTDADRSQHHHCDNLKHHYSLLVGCLKYMMADLRSPGKQSEQSSVTYAYWFWCHHLLRVMSLGGDLNHVNRLLGDRLESFSKKMANEWMKPWFYKFEDFDVVKTVGADFFSVTVKLRVRRCLSRLDAFTDANST